MYNVERIISTFKFEKTPYKKNWSSKRVKILLLLLFLQGKSKNNPQIRLIKLCHSVTFVIVTSFL